MKLAVVLTLVVVLILAIVVVLSNQQKSITIETKQIDLAGQPLLGGEEAPVTVVEFGDFKCPGCKAWGEIIFPKLANDFIDTGIVKFSFVNVLFHGEESTLGSIAAESVLKRSPDVYWEFHEALYKAQPTEDHDALWITPGQILEIANKFPEIDQSMLKEDMEQQATMESVQRDHSLVKEVGVTMTPTIVVNGKVMEDPFDYEAIKKEIEQAAEDK